MGDRRDVASCGPFALRPGATTDFDFAVVWTRDTTLPWLSQSIFDKNKHDNQKIQYWFANNNFPSCLNLSGLGVAEQQLANEVVVYPNPSNGKLNLSMSQIENSPIRAVEIFNVYGEKVFSANGYQLIAKCK